MRDTGKYNILHFPLAPALAVFCFRMSEQNSPKGSETVKITTLYRLTGYYFFKYLETYETLSFNEPILSYRILLVSMKLNGSDSFSLHLMKMSSKCVKIVLYW